MKKNIQPITTLICFALCSASVQAAALYWDTDGVAAGASSGTTANGTWGADDFWTTSGLGDVATGGWTAYSDAILVAGSDVTDPSTITLASGATQIAASLTVETATGLITITDGGGTGILNVGGGIGGGVASANISIKNSSGCVINTELTGGDTGSGSITKQGAGPLVLSGANTYVGQTVVQDGTLSFNTIGNVVVGGPGVPSALGAPTNELGGTLKIGTFGVGGTVKYTGTGHSTDRVINQAGTTGGATIEASGSGPIVFTNTNGVTSTGNGIKMLSLTGTNTADNTIGGTIVNFSSAKYTRIEKRDAGTWVLTGLNTFSGVCDIREGTLVINSVADAGIASSVGTGSQGGAHTWIGLGGSVVPTTNATLKYIGTGHSTTRRIHLWGSTIGGAVIDASGTGPLALQDINRPPSDTADKTVTLKGTSIDANTIRGQIFDSTSGVKTFITKDGVGKWILTGVNLYTGATKVNGGTLLVNSPGSLAAGSAVSVGPGATLGGTGTIGGPVIVAADGILSPGASVGTLTLSSNLTLSGSLFIELDKSLSPYNDVVNVAGTLTNAGTGTVTVTNLGPVLAAGDSFQLFNKAVANGEALTIVSAGGEVWTNKLAVDGSIAVVPASLSKVPATNLTIVAVSPTSFNLGGVGAANSAYNVYASTNVTTPMTNWWLVGTTNSNGGGVIQFLDPQATNEQRFYRFGQ